MQIDRIKLTNFKSIQEIDLNFQEMNGLWEISGVVGAGKTTIGEAIIYGLFGSVRGKTNESLISWGKKHALVETWIYCKNTHLYIRREINAYGQSPLIATADGEEILASDKRSIQGILEKEWYDIPRQTLELLCVISFNNFKSMSTLNTQESRDFLNSTISFDKLTTYEDWCKDKIRDITEQYNLIKSRKSGAETALETLNNIAPAVPKYTDQKVIDKEVLDTGDALRKLIEKHREERKQYQNAANESVAEHKVVVKKINDLKKSIKQLSGATCPLCGQVIDDKHKSLLHHEFEMLEAEEQRLNTIAQTKCKEANDFDQEMGVLQEKLDNKLIHLQHEQYITKQYINALKKHDNESERLNKIIHDSTKELDDLQNDISGYQDMITFIKDTVRPTIISSIIPSINNHIDYYMKAAHQNYIIKYDENFKCLMKNPYGDMIPIYSLSTGQKKVIDMIIILAFIKTFITQINFNIYFLDELIGNIDADLRDTMCGLLRDSLDETDVMFLISHSPINQEYLDGFIKVTRSGGISQYEIMNIQK